MPATYVLTILFATAAWVAYDSRDRDLSGITFADRSWKWVLGCLGLWVVAFPAYLVLRRRAPTHPGGASSPVRGTPSRPEVPTLSTSVAPPGWSPAR